MKWIGRVFLVYFALAFISLLLIQIGLSLDLYRTWLSEGQSVFSYSWFIPTTAVSFYIYNKIGVSRKRIFSIVFIVMVAYITWFALSLWQNPSFISYVEFYDATWKYTRDEIVLRYQSIPIHPWLLGALFGYLLGFLKEHYTSVISKGNSY